MHSVWGLWSIDMCINWANLFYGITTYIFITFTIFQEMLKFITLPSPTNVSVTSIFLSPVRFLARTAEWSPRRNFTPVLFSWSHQATGPARHDTAVHLWFDPIIRKTPHGPRAIPVRAWYGPRTEISNVFISNGTRTGPLRDTQGCRTAPLRARKGIDTTRICKSHTGVVNGRAGHLRSPHGLFTGCLRSLNLHRARKLIIHALKLYGPRTGMQNSYGAARGPYGPREWTYDFC